MNQYILFILPPFLVLLFSFFIVKNKRIAWVFLIVAHLEPFLIEFISPRFQLQVQQNLIPYQKLD